KKLANKNFKQKNNMDPAAAKQQIAERVKQANKFLVTVNANPTVDQLAACIGLTLLLNKMGKHATAIFSGKVPSTIEFLQPQKTLQTNTDSLRDFIISLDKNKADKLRYKVEQDVVRIFITPYRTSLSEKDLVFSQGDFNVEVVLALGVKDRTQLDAAITAHGRILHDATVVSVNAGQGKAPALGQINWQDEQASSLCEMLVSISEAFGPGLLDAQMATAFLTGIVAETQRFSNAKTSPKVMTMSAQLMAAGANQQLIVSKLEPPPPPPPKKPPAPPPKPPEPKPPKPPAPKPQGELNVSHDRDNKQEDTEIQVAPTEIRIDEQGNLVTDQDLAQKSPNAGVIPLPMPQPSAPAAEQSNAEEPHAYLGSTAPGASTGSSASSGQPDWASPYDLVPVDPFSQVDGFNEDLPSGRTMPPPSAPQADHNVDEIGVTTTTPQPQTLPSSVDSARSAVDSAIAAAPFDPSFAPPVEALNAQPLGEPELAPPTSVPAVPANPPAVGNDTPMLVLPTDSTGGLTASQPVVNQTPPAPLNNVAPPPVPPPLTIAPGAIMPNPPHDQ
ncbi:MAG: hypothetical protein ACREGG_02660, partial [Candidatus Saccharimonadales bacterium]